MQLENRNALYWSGFGNALSKAGNPGAAYSAFAEAAAREPWNPLHSRNMALMKLASGDEASALQLLQRAIGQDPVDAESLRLAAILTLNKGRYPIAAEYSRRTLRLVPTDVTMYVTAARAEAALNRFSEADALLVDGIKRTGSVSLHLLRAQILMQAGDTSGALSEARFVLGVEPANKDALDIVAKLQH